MKRYDLYMIIRRLMKWRCLFSSYNKGKRCAYLSYKKCPSRIIIRMFFVKSLKQKYLQFSIFIVKAILDNGLIFFCIVHLIKWDFLDKPHARLSSGKRILNPFLFTHIHLLSPQHLHGETQAQIHTHLYRHTYIQRLTDSESHTELDRESHRVRLSQPLTDRYKHLRRVKHRQTLTQTHSGGCMGITDKKHLCVIIMRSVIVCDWQPLKWERCREHENVRRNWCLSSNQMP